MKAYEIARVLPKLCFIGEAHPLNKWDKRWENELEIPLFDAKSKYKWNWPKHSWKSENFVL